MPCKEFIMKDLIKNLAAGAAIALVLTLCSGWQALSGHSPYLVYAEVALLAYGIASAVTGGYKKPLAGTAAGTAVFMAVMLVMKPAEPAGFLYTVKGWFVDQPAYAWYPLWQGMLYTVAAYVAAAWVSGLGLLRIRVRKPAPAPAPAPTKPTVMQPAAPVNPFLQAAPAAEAAPAAPAPGSVSHALEGCKNLRKQAAAAKARAEAAGFALQEARWADQKSSTEEERRVTSRAIQQAEAAAEAARAERVRAHNAYIDQLNKTADLSSARTAAVLESCRTIQVPA